MTDQELKKIVQDSELALPLHKRNTATNLLTTLIPACSNAQYSISEILECLKLNFKKQQIYLSPKQYDKLQQLIKNCL